MSRVNAQNHINQADGEPATIGRGSGFTIAEMSRRLKEVLKRRKIPNHNWRDKKFIRPIPPEQLKNN